MGLQGISVGVAPLELRALMVGCVCGGGKLRDPFLPGMKVMLQNQHGAGKIAKKWDKTGLVLEDLGYNKYRIKVDGSGRVTDRNRQFLRQFTPVTATIPGPRPNTSYVPEPVLRPEPVQLVPEINPEPVLAQQVPEINHEPQVPNTPKQVVPSQTTSPTTPESPSFVTPPTTPTAAITPEPPRRSSRNNKGVPPERLTYSKF